MCFVFDTVLWKFWSYFYVNYCSFINVRLMYTYSSVSTVIFVPLICRYAPFSYGTYFSVTILKRNAIVGRRSPAVPLSPGSGSPHSRRTGSSPTNPPEGLSFKFNILFSFLHFFLYKKVIPLGIFILPRS